MVNEVPQPSEPTEHVADEAVYKELDDRLVSAVGEVIAASIATTVSAAATITADEITLAQALVEIKTSKPKDKGDKGKAIMIEEPMKPKKKDQIRLDEKAALKLQAKFNEEEQRLARERRKLKDLKNKSFDFIQNMFHRAFNRVNTFVDFRTKLVKGSLKRAGEELTQESSKKEKVDDDKEIAELKELMEIIPDKEEVAINAIPLAVKSPKIVDWKIHKEEKKSYYQIIRGDKNSKMYMVFNRIFKEFNREDLEDLYNLVKAKYGSTKPVEDLDLLLWGDLKTMFEPHIEDQV
nr:hypothetical protein [Tanacetum cinerariifolium]